MNIIGIDPSLISTAIVVNEKIFNYCREEEAALKKGGLNKWFKLCEEYVQLRYVKYRNYDNYSDGELIKLKDYDKITDQIISDIINNIDKTLKTKVAIEGFSFGSSSANALIDLVTFSTLLRKKLFDYVTEDITVLSPSTLKLESCKMTYTPIDVGKKKPKLEWRNKLGISGGNFTKTDIFLSMVENDDMLDNWSLLCKENKDLILEKKMIPKPFEDINDAIFLYYFLKKTIKNL